MVTYALPELLRINGDFLPIEGLQRPDADLVLKLIGKNHVRYRNRVDDLIYDAHRLLLTDEQGSDTRYYTSDSTVSMVGCAQQVGQVSIVLNIELT
jgi:hypothetical protein